MCLHIINHEFAVYREIFNKISLIYDIPHHWDRFEEIASFGIVYSFGKPNISKWTFLIISIKYIPKYY